MESKFTQFLKENKIDPRRLSAASRDLERLRREDRQVKLQKRASKKEGAPAPGADAKPISKPRSGRGASLILLARAAQPKGITGPNKQRVLRAVNHILAQRKKDPVELKALF